MLYCNVEIGLSFAEFAHKSGLNVSVAINKNLNQEIANTVHSFKHKLNFWTNKWIDLPID